MVKQDAKRTIFSTRSSKGIGLYTISWTSQTSPWTHWKSTEENKPKVSFPDETHYLKQNRILWSHVAIDCHIRFRQGFPTTAPQTGTGLHKHWASAQSPICACTRLGCARETMLSSHRRHHPPLPSLLVRGKIGDRWYKIFTTLSLRASIKKCVLVKKAQLTTQPILSYCSIYRHKGLPRNSLFIEAPT